jgi:hypothetical protein
LHITPAYGSPASFSTFSRAFNVDWLYWEHLSSVPGEEERCRERKGEAGKDCVVPLLIVHTYSFFSWSLDHLSRSTFVAQPPGTMSSTVASPWGAACTPADGAASPWGTPSARSGPAAPSLTEVSFFLLLLLSVHCQEFLNCCLDRCRTQGSPHFPSAKHTLTRTHTNVDGVCVCVCVCVCVEERTLVDLHACMHTRSHTLTNKNCKREEWNLRDVSLVPVGMCQATHSTHLPITIHTSNSLTAALDCR